MLNFDQRFNGQNFSAESAQIISLDAYLNIVFNDIIFGDMHRQFLDKYLVEIWYKLQRGPINQDGGSTSITHGSQNWNRVQ